MTRNELYTLITDVMRVSRPRPNTEHMHQWLHSRDTFAARLARAHAGFDLERFNADCEPPPYVDRTAAGQLLMRLFRTKGRNEAVVILDRFGAKNLSQVHPQQLLDLCAAIKALLGES